MSSSTPLPEQRRVAVVGRPGSALEVGAAFLKLGLTSFGGPIAHLGYFRREFVERRRWIDEEHFGQLIGLCQFLPGPASSQLGFSLGLLRAGWLGALAAFIGFTLPSALLLYALAASSNYLAGAWGEALVHGLKLVAVAVVAQGVLGMARTLTPDAPRALMAAAAAGLVAVGGPSWMQLLVIAGGAGLGPWLCRRVTAHPGGSFTLRYGRRTGTALVVLFGVLLIIALTVAPGRSPMGQVAGAFYRTGALVFGGGHVVLPLLKQAVVDPGWLDNGTFLAGYGAAQAVPGPMFTVSVYLGDRLFGGQGGALGATVSLLAIFLPGLLIVSGVLPFWQTLSARDGTARMLAGVNAAVVGLLAAALYDPVWISTVRDSKDFAIALVGFVFLVGARWPAWIVVLWCVLASLGRTAF
ncbi:MAG TPA: chromate efflux transporter [Steroidobacteraceae bacterium]|jgi:chromate transporter|nr:chromate efflux transporter [Steroidobacteraceae bacterium]